VGHKLKILTKKLVRDKIKKGGIKKFESDAVVISENALLFTLCVNCANGFQKKNVNTVPANSSIQNGS
jgi:hypothetical protein